MRVAERYLKLEQAPEQKAASERWLASRATFRTQGVQPTLAALERGDLVEAQRILETVTLPSFVPVREATDALLALRERAVDEAVAEADRRFTTALWFLAAILAVAVIGAIAAGSLLTRAISSAVAASGKALAGLARGELDQSLPSRRDEFEALLASIRTVSLARCVG